MHKNPKRTGLRFNTWYFTCVSDVWSKYNPSHFRVLLVQAIGWVQRLLQKITSGEWLFRSWMATQENSEFVSPWSGFVSMSLRCWKPEIFWSYTSFPPPNVCCYHLQCDGQPFHSSLQWISVVCCQTLKPLPVSVRGRIVLRLLYLWGWFPCAHWKRVWNLCIAHKCWLCREAVPELQWAPCWLGGTVVQGKGTSWVQEDDLHVGKCF